MLVLAKLVNDGLSIHSVVVMGKGEKKDEKEALFCNVFYRLYKGGHLDEMDPFQFGSRPGDGIEEALVSLPWETGRKNATLLILLELSVAVSTIDHYILLGPLLGLGLGCTVLQCFRVCNQVADNRCRDKGEASVVCGM